MKYTAPGEPDLLQKIKSPFTGSPLLSRVPGRFGSVSTSSDVPQRMSPGFSRLSLSFRALVTAICVVAAGCGTTKWSDTGRTGTEQLLISQAIDYAVEKIDFGILGGKKVYLNTEAIKDAVDHQYLKTTLRQSVAASGAFLCDDVENCDFILEVRSGAVGTDRNDVLVGVPSTSVPYLSGGTFSTVQMPEIPLVKKTDQRAIVKIAVFAYDRESGHPLWASGNKLAETRAKAWWIFGAGPIHKGTIYPEARFGGENVHWLNTWKGKKNLPVERASLPMFFEASGPGSEPVNATPTGHAVSTPPAVPAPSRENTDKPAPTVYGPMLFPPPTVPRTP